MRAPGGWSLAERIKLVLGGATHSTPAKTLVLDEAIPNSLLASPAGQSLISSTTLGSDTASVTFSSIPATYKHLLVICQVRTTSAAAQDQLRVQFNSDTGANYDTMRLQVLSGGIGNAAVAGETSAQSLNLPGAGVARGAEAGVGQLVIANYAGTTFEKTFAAVGGFADSTIGNSILQHCASAWRNTAAINAIKLFPSAGPNFKSGSIFTLYGLN